MYWIVPSLRARSKVPKAWLLSKQKHFAHLSQSTVRTLRAQICTLRSAAWVWTSFAPSALASLSTLSMRLISRLPSLSPWTHHCLYSSDLSTPICIRVWSWSVHPNCLKSLVHLQQDLLIFNRYISILTSNLTQRLWPLSITTNWITAATSPDKRSHRWSWETQAITSQYDNLSSSYGCRSIS